VRLKVEGIKVPRNRLRGALWPSESIVLGGRDNNRRQVAGVAAHQAVFVPTVDVVFDEGVTTASRTTLESPGHRLPHSWAGEARPDSERGTTRTSSHLTSPIDSVKPDPRCVKRIILITRPSAEKLGKSYPWCCNTALMRYRMLMSVATDPHI